MQAAALRRRARWPEEIGPLGTKQLADNPASVPWEAGVSFASTRLKAMKDPILLRRKDTLSVTEASYWKDLFYRTVKIGTELEVAPPKGCDRPTFERAVRTALSPSGCLENLGANGVLDVKPEHCGIEVRVIGRQPHFWALLKQYTSIMSALRQAQARPRPTCGLHFHVLTPGLAEPVPEIILANLWNLTRRYAPELKFVTSGGESRDVLCRRRQYNSHLEMIRHSPSLESMAEIQQSLQKSHVVPEHQNFINLEHLGFTSPGAILPFHLEFRFPDADISALSVTAKTFLFLALLLKSVDLAQYGLIHVGKFEPWKRKIELLGLLSNNDGNLASSDTSGVSDEVIDELREGCHEMLDLLMPTFEYLDATAAYQLLEILADSPISLLRCAGNDWNQIDAILQDHLPVPCELDVDQIDHRLMQRIELEEWSGQASQDTWQWHAARELHITPQDLECRLDRLRSVRGLRWDTRQGTMVFGN